MDIISLLTELNISFREFGQHHHTTQDFVQVDCPFCSKDSNSFKLGINLTKLFSTCWSCGWHPLYEVLRELTHLPIPRLDLSPSAYTRELKGKLIIPKGVGELLKPHKRYLSKRGFDPEYLASFWGLKGIGISAKYSWRVFIPIKLNGEVVSWTTRSISDQGKRYLNSPLSEEKLSPKKMLFGSDLVKHSIIVCEGAFDVFRIGPGAVCTMGLKYTKEQVLLISKYPLRVICFDSEPTAQRVGARLCSELECFPGETYKVSLNSKDPGSGSEKEIKALRKRFLD